MGPVGGGLGWASPARGGAHGGESSAPEGLTFVAHRLEGIFCDAKGRYDTQPYGGPYLFRPKGKRQLGLVEYS